MSWSGKILFSQGLESTVEKMLLDSPAVKSAIARFSAATERYEESVRKKEELEAMAQLTPKQKEESEELMVHSLCSSLPEISCRATNSYGSVSSASCKRNGSKQQN